jgi:Kdo2-lipid IVA lauroyltransferase/acyltransferase
MSKMGPEYCGSHRFYAPRYWPIWLGFVLYRAAIALPWSWMTHLGRNLGRMAMHLTPRRVRITDINLKLCFPDLNDAERHQLRRRHFEYLGLGLIDMGLAWWANEARLQPWLRIHGAEHAVAAFHQGRGVIFLTAHFTALEMSGRALATLGPVHAVYRPHQHPLIEYFVKTRRERHTEQAIPRDDVRLLMRTLKAGRGLGFAPDQNFSHKGCLFSPFFGIATATNSATSRLARLSGAPVVPFVAFRREDGPGYDLYIESALKDFPSDDLQRDTDRINAITERWVHRAPAQYLWAHRRFKDRPAGEPGFY